MYLTGDFPPAFRRLEQGVRETLTEFQVYGGANLNYIFIDPSAGSTEAARNAFYQTLFKKGLKPTNLGATENGKRVEKIIFPYAVVSVGGHDKSVLLLRGNQAAPADVRLNQSIEGLEYELASTIRTLVPALRKRIGVVEGHGELTNVQAGDMLGTWQQQYDVFRVTLSKVKDLSALDAIVVAQPKTPYSEDDKFKLDQFITQGGRAMFFVDALRVDLDSVSRNGVALATPYDLNLDDLFFKYGLRLNQNLLLDLNSGQIPLVTGMDGNKPKIEPMPWQLYPLINKFSPHPITRNLDAVYLKFVGNMDTVQARGIRKTALMSTSRYTRVLPAPVPINFNDARLEPNPKLYQNRLPAGGLPARRPVHLALRQPRPARHPAVPARKAAQRQAQQNPGHFRRRLHPLRHRPQNRQPLPPGLRPPRQHRIRQPRAGPQRHRLPARRHRPHRRARQANHPPPPRQSEAGRAAPPVAAAEPGRAAGAAGAVRGRAGVAAQAALRGFRRIKRVAAFRFEVMRNWSKHLCCFACRETSPPAPLLRRDTSTSSA